MVMRLLVTRTSTKKRFLSEARRKSRRAFFVALAGDQRYYTSMSQRYFHKVDPKNAIIFPNGTSWRGWEVVDHQNGVFAPRMEALVDGLSQCARGGVGGVSEINESQYQDWVKKKVSVLPRLWREEVQMGNQALQGRQEASPNTTSAAPPVRVVAGNYKPDAVEA